VVAALNGGEDYELLFTVPIATHDVISEMKGVRIIGHIVAENAGAMLVTPHGEEVAISAQGWNALANEEEDE
jgi:thiamine-monophosphate kinase